MTASLALLATHLLACLERDAKAGLLVVVDGEGRADALARLVGQMEPDQISLCFPAWDCLPYDRAPPSPDLMGHRMRVLQLLRKVDKPALVVTTPDALLRRLPPKDGLAGPARLAVGATLDLERFGVWCARVGYAHADRVEDPGQVAIRGETVDIFSTGTAPYRITVLEGAVTAIHRYDPATQRSRGELQKIRLDPMSEVVLPVGEATERFSGMEHWLPLFHPATETLLDYIPAAAEISVEPAAETRLARNFEAIAEAYRDRLQADQADQGAARRPIDPERAFLTADDWQRAAETRGLPFPHPDAALPAPRFCLEDKPGRAFAGFLRTQLKAGQRVVLGAARREDAATLAREAARACGQAPAPLARWRDLEEAAPGALAAMKLSADHGFVDEEGGVTLVTAADLLGHHARASSYHAVPMPWHLGEGEFALGDLVIHIDHGVGLLKELETLEDGAASGRDTLRLDYARGANLLAPVEDLDRIWRYGPAQEGVALDKLDSDAWQTRRAGLVREVAETARRLVELARQRNETVAPVIVPPRRDYERFVAGFPFAPTPDQIHAVDDCLRDLASGRPMDRLVVGDVGFGKTEVALRAAAAAVLAGWQVAVVAPTTVLVRQHLHQFEKRFGAIGVGVGQLSRLLSAAEAGDTKAELAQGRLRLVVATHALAAADVRFDRLGLLIVDEEQRFGAADKARLRELGAGAHVLTLSATPIPRTLQSALVGLQDLSLVATPPARRRPIRTLVAPFDTATIRTALRREKARGGQSFVVAPRIEDLGPLGETLKALLPDFRILVGHGGMEAQAVDEAMVTFAGGAGDVLLATSIIESGLDVPHANTMIVCGADRFGLAQLHQLRGRVGRGRQQGTCYLMTAAGEALPEATQRRLSTLATLDRLGSGLAISTQDLDARGAGDLVGDEQTGHMKLIGRGLYQHLLQLAIREARGEAVEDWSPELHLGDAARLDAAYIPEVEVRLNLYARLARVTEVAEVAALEDEIQDRFGPLPSPALALLARARLRSLCRRHAIARADAGPKGFALTPRPGTSAEALAGRVAAFSGTAAAGRNGRVIIEGRPAAEAEAVAALTALLQDAPPP